MDVLIVDDDPAVSATCARLLERAGFMVKAVDNGLAALAELHQQPYRAIVCDFQMPFLEGRKLYDELLHALPEMARRVVFVTGWAEDHATRRYLLGTGQPFMGKPPDAKELVRVVRQIADQPRVSS